MSQDLSLGSIISFIIYFISSAERQGQELHSTRCKKAENEMYFRYLVRTSVLKIELYEALLSPLHHFPTWVCYVPFLWHNRFTQNFSRLQPLSLLRIHFSPVSFPIACMVSNIPKELLMASIIHYLFP